MNKLAVLVVLIALSAFSIDGTSQSYFPGARTSGPAGGVAPAPGAPGYAPQNTFASPIVLGQDSTNRIITTAIPWLTISPDSRSAALGDAGVALSPDANAAYWNAGKLAFIDKAYGGSASYTPWLGKIINDMWVFSLAGFYKINHNQAVAVSMKYFNYGPFYGKDLQNQPTGQFNPRDATFDVTYSQLLTEHFGIGGSLRYIYSNLTGALSNGNEAHSGNSVAVDLGVFYSKPLESSNSTLSWGASISNLGSKVTYSDAAHANFIPTNLKIGGAFKTDIDPTNSFTFLLDFNKLMVPSNKLNSNQTPLLKGVLGSFGDAQGGFKEEIHEITTSVGVEYWYNKVFAGRLGYFYEALDKGNRKYLTSGVGVRYEKFGLDVAYLVPTNRRESPLAETIRFSILIHIDAKTKEQQETLTD